MEEDQQLGEIADRLYRLPPEQFVAAREEEVKRLRGERQRELAAEVHGLRRPNKAAWLVNLLALDAPAEMLDRLDTLGERLREAQTNLAGQDLRDLTQQRRGLIDSLVRYALEQAERAGSPAPGSAEEAATTLAAALADPETAAAVRSGRLLSGLEYSGFGPAPRADLSSAPVPARERPKSTMTARKAAAKGRAAAPARAAGTAEAGTAEREADRKAERAAEREARKAAEAARKAYAEAEERVTAARAEQASARQAEADAKAEVDRLLAELGAAREALTVAGRRARKARADLSTAERELAAARRRLPPP